MLLAVHMLLVHRMVGVERHVDGVIRTGRPRTVVRMGRVAIRSILVVVPSTVAGPVLGFIASIHCANVEPTNILYMELSICELFAIDSIYFSQGLAREYL